MHTYYKKMGSHVLKALHHDPQTGNTVPYEHLKNALYAVVMDDVPAKELDNADHEIETGYDREEDVIKAVDFYLNLREENEDPCLSVEDYALLLGFVVREVWGDLI